MITVRDQLAITAQKLFKSELSFGDSMREDTILPQNKNFVCKVQLLLDPRDRFNLPLLASKLPNAKYHQLKFAAVTLRMDNTVVLIFESGKVIMMKGRSAEQSFYLMHEYRLLLEALPMTIYNCETGAVYRNATLCGRLGFDGWVVENIVANSRILQKSVLLGKLSDDHAEQCTYNADWFPGASWQCELSDGTVVTVKIFTTCKVVYMGAKSKAQVREAHELITRLLRDYNAEDIPDDPRLRTNYRLQHIFRRAGFTDDTRRRGRRRIAPTVRPGDITLGAPNSDSNDDDDDDSQSVDDEEAFAQEFLLELLEEEEQEEQRQCRMGSTLYKACVLQRVDTVRNMMDNGVLRPGDLLYHPEDDDGGGGGDESLTIKSYLERNATNVNIVAIMAILEPLLQAHS